MQGVSKDGVGAAVVRLERWHVAVPLKNTVGARARSSGSCGGGVVSSGRMFGSTECLRKLLKKNF